ncbi:MAG: trypsin-like peptidase domain-containing protein [Candidatus Bathyarchaeota archaeon]|nr:trypsin-like peptidase domain-containing protein [Candidatus Bathyarchaeum sp.]
MEVSEKPKNTHTVTMLATIVVISSLISAGLFGYLICYSTTSGDVADLQNQVTSLQEQLTQLESTQNPNSQNTTVLIEEKNVSVSELYAQVADSVVIIRGMVFSYYDFFGRRYYSQVQGSGFVSNFTGEAVVVTNYHVIGDAVNITVTFSNGNSYPAEVLGSDPYAELAVISVVAPEDEYVPLEIVSSSNLQVGDPVMVVGTPYGLAGSMSTGFVSALGRTLTAETTGGYVIPNVIQTTAPLNPGNSGGPVLNYQGQVVGIATAIVEDSQGVGFVIPSNTILREISDLISKGSYDDHPWLGVSGTDMSYEIAEEMAVDVTYGWLIAEVASDGPADKAGLQGGTEQIQINNELVVVGGDIIIAINGTRITSIDDMSAYLEEYTLPGETINITIIRANKTDNIVLELESRPAATSAT